MVASPLDLGADRAKILIKSLAHNDTVSFVPYNFTFDDNFKPEWQEYNAFGRMDPVMVYKKTSRDINISFDVVSHSDLIQNTKNEDLASSSERNFIHLQTLIKFLYPKYATIGSGKTVEQLNEELDITGQALARARDGSGAALLNNNILGIQELSQEFQKIEGQILDTIAENRTLEEFGTQIIQKSPLFVIKFLNLINNSQYVCAVTNFKHKLFFDEGATNNTITKNGQLIPGKFNISLGFKVVHNYLPGTQLNY